MALGFQNKHLRTAMRTCEETVFSITRFENQIETALILVSVEFFFLNTSLLIGH